MSKALLTTTLQVGLAVAFVELHAGAIDPSAVGFVAPIGSGYLSTATGDWWRKTGALDTDWTPVGAGGGGAAQAFTYICTGAEGSDFFIALPVNQPDVNYIPQVTCGGVAVLFLIDCPDLVGTDRKINEFRVETSIAVTAGDRLDVVISART